MSATITTPEELTDLQRAGSCAVLTADGEPAILWMGEDQQWHSIRPTTEDEWNAGARTLAQSAGIDLIDDDVDDLLPLIVLWRDDKTIEAEADSLRAEVDKLRKHLGELIGERKDAEVPGVTALPAVCLMAECVACGESIGGDDAEGGWHFGSLEEVLAAGYERQEDGIVCPSCAGHRRCAQLGGHLWEDWHGYWVCTREDCDAYSYTDPAVQS